MPDDDHQRDINHRGSHHFGTRVGLTHALQSNAGELIERRENRDYFRHVGCGRGDGVPSFRAEHGDSIWRWASDVDGVAVLSGDGLRFGD